MTWVRAPCNIAELTTWSRSGICTRAPPSRLAIPSRWMNTNRSRTKSIRLRPLARHQVVVLRVLLEEDSHEWAQRSQRHAGVAHVVQNLGDQQRRETASAVRRIDLGVQRGERVTVQLVVHEAGACAVDVELVAGLGGKVADLDQGCVCHAANLARDRRSEQPTLTRPPGQLVPRRQL